MIISIIIIYCTFIYIRFILFIVFIFNLFILILVDSFCAHLFILTFHLLSPSFLFSVRTHCPSPRQVGIQRQMVYPTSFLLSSEFLSFL